MPKPARNPALDRKRQLGRIHAGKKALGLDDDTYRALLVRMTGKRSSADMTAAERNAVIAELVRQGFKADAKVRRKRAWAGRPSSTDQVPMLKKVEALLADAGREWAYAHGLAKKMFQRDRLEFLRHDELHKLVAALQVDANRTARKGS